MMTNVPEILAKIRSGWLHRVAHDMARGAGVRENFQGEIERFYDLMVQAAQTGDPGWIDPILKEWSKATTLSDLEEGQKNISAILNRMIMITYDMAREDLSGQEALDVLGALLPIFTISLEKAARYEMETRVAYISNELTGVQQKLER
jgi:hypothetical protein